MSNRFYFQQRFRNRLYEAVIRAIEANAAQTGLRRKALAERIGKTPASLSRLLAGPGNWELDTVSDLLFAIDAELDFRIAKFDDRTPANHFHPLNGTIISFVAQSTPDALVKQTPSTRGPHVAWSEQKTAGCANG